MPDFPLQSCILLIDKRTKVSIFVLEFFDLYLERLVLFDHIFLVFLKLTLHFYLLVLVSHLAFELADDGVLAVILVL